MKRALLLLAGLVASCMGRPVPAFAATTGQVGTQPVILKASSNLGTGLASGAVLLSGTTTGVAGEWALLVKLTSSSSPTSASTVYPGAGTTWTVTPAGWDQFVAPKSGTAGAVVWTGSSVGDVHGQIGPLTTSTTGAPVLMYNAKTVTYTVIQTGGTGGVTLFVDVSNMDTCPASVTGVAAEVAQWQTITPSGSVVALPAPSAALGAATNNAFVVNGYRWMRWRIETLAGVGGPTCYVMYKGVVE